MNTGTELRHKRQELGLSQAKLAELSGVSQHQLSAFELEKKELPASLVEAVSLALADSTNVTRVVSRAKRYREHKYIKVTTQPDRLARATQSEGNAEYCKILDRLAADHSKERDSSLSAISLFSGCGGFSLGFSAAGFAVRGFLELNDDFRKIYKQNFPRSRELGGDISKISQESLLRISEELAGIDVIIGGPPCQGFSLSGKRQVDDPRNVLFRHYLRFVNAFKPRMAILENVRLLTSMRSPSGGFVKDVICEEFRRHGYEVRYFEVNAKNYGVPQHRERVLFVALRSDLGLVPTLPEPSHLGQSDMFFQTRPYRTFADACSDLPFIESGEKSDDPFHEAVKHPAHVIDWLWDVPEGRSAHENDLLHKRPPSGYNTTYKRQVWNEPAATVQTTFGMISGCRNVHPIATRSLTIREAARLQSFPDSFQLQGSLGAVRTAIGNAVPPLLAFAIARHMKQLLSKFCRSSKLPD